MIRKLAINGTRSTGKSQLFYNYWQGLAFLEIVRKMVEVKRGTKQGLLASVCVFDDKRPKKIDF